jgi:hypothetical protein
LNGRENLGIVVIVGGDLLREDVSRDGMEDFVDIFFL